MARYAQYESALLRQELAPYCAASASKDLIDELRACAVSVAKVAAVVEGASKRCCDVTEGEEMMEQKHTVDRTNCTYFGLGCAYPQLKLAIEESMGAYLER